MVFISVVAGKEQIFRMGMDGSNPQQLTHDDADHEDPAWSPDGNHIAFVLKKGDLEQIQVMNADGSQVEPLTPKGIRTIHPNWSPDSRSVAYCTNDDIHPPQKESAEIYSIELSSRHITKLISGGVNTYPAWSPDGKNIPHLSISPPLVRRVSRGKQSAVQEADMAGQHRPSEGLKSIVGGALVGLGLHILFGNLDRVAEQMKHMLGTAAWETLGVLPSAVLAASQAVQAYGLDHQGFLQSLLWMLISFWPLLLVIAGTVLLRNFFTEKVKALPAPEKYFQNKNMGCRFRAFSFDV